jgi:hypothetical protein
MLSDDARRTIDALSREELVQEIHKEHRSRFQGDGYAYLKTRLASIEQQERAEQEQKAFQLDAEAIEVARDANKIAQESNTIATRAYRMSIFSVVVAIIATLIALLSQSGIRP